MPIGFHDAYVAAPSQKAAAEAWGTDKDVFRRGEAEIVTDPELTKEPLARPGRVVKRLRATAEDHLAALPPNRPRSSRPTGKANAGSHACEQESRPSHSVVPRPSPAAVEEAEAAIAETKQKYDRTLRRMGERLALLAKERADVEKARDTELRQLEKAREKASARYDRALAKWRAR